ASWPVARMPHLHRHSTPSVYERNDQTRVRPPCPQHSPAGPLRCALGDVRGGRVGWEFWIDRGGTFTDVVARDPDGQLHTHKLLSADPERYADAAVAAIERLAGPEAQVDTVRMGTTLATNALLERRGEPTVLVTTRGFGDALTIGYQDRPHIFARHIVRPGVLHD